jgi:hypothetical protein
MSFQQAEEISCLHTAVMEAGIEPAWCLGLLRVLLPGDASRGVATADDAARVEAACTVWELSADPTSAAFMRQHGLVPLLLHPLAHPQDNSARMLEVCAGAASNLASVDATARNELVDRLDTPSVLSTLLQQTADASTIGEVLRLLSTLLHHAASGTDSPRARAVLLRWLDALATHSSLTPIVFVVANALRPELIARAASLLATLLHCEHAAGRTTTGTGQDTGTADPTADCVAVDDDAGAGASGPPLSKRPKHSPREGIASVLLELGLGSSLHTVLVAQCRELPGEAEPAVRALVQLLDALLATAHQRAEDHGGSDGDDKSRLAERLAHDKGLRAELVGMLAASRGLSLELRADVLAGVAAMGEYDEHDGDGGGAISPISIAFDVRVIDAALSLLRGCADAIGLEGDSEDCCPEGCEVRQLEEGGQGSGPASYPMGSTVDGARAAWTLLHRAAASLDGFCLCLPSSPEHAGISAVFVKLLARARRLRSCVDWATQPGARRVSVAGLAEATVAAILEAANVVVTADGCTSALARADDGDGHSDGDRNDDVGIGDGERAGNGDATERVLHAIAVLSGGDSETGRSPYENRKTPSGDDSASEFDDGAGIATTHEAWASSDDGDCQD